MGLGVKAAGESRQCSGRPDDPVARRDDRHRIAAVRGADRAHGGRIPDLTRDLPVGSRLAERDRQQRVPHRALKGGAGEIQRQRERLAVTGKILLELAGRLEQHRVAAVLRLDRQPDSTRTIVGPQNSGKTLVSRDQGESSHRRIHHFVHIPLRCAVIGSSHGILLLIVH
jgi:hypothetical protein